jgi:hypothetical protein
MDARRNPDQRSARFYKDFVFFAWSLQFPHSVLAFKAGAVWTPLASAKRGLDCCAPA